jgi:hypothetical protein
MPRLVELKPLKKYRLWLRYDDGAQGEVDLSDLAGRGVFKAWDNESPFETARIGDDGEIAWSDELDLCPDSVYMQLTGKTPEDVFPRLKRVPMDA